MSFSALSRGAMIAALCSMPGLALAEIVVSDAYARASRTLRRLGDEHTAAIAAANAGAALVDVGDAPGALSRLAAAAAVFEAAGHDNLALETQHNLATALVAAGRPGEGLARLEEVEKISNERGLCRRAGLAGIDLAAASLHAGERREAESHALRAAAAFAAEGAPAERVEALWLAAAAAASPSPDRASLHLDHAERAALRTERPGLALRCDLLGIDHRHRQGLTIDLRELARIRRDTRSLGMVELSGQCLLLAGDVALGQVGDRSGGVARARATFSDPLLRRPGHPWLRAAADTGLAQADAIEGRIGSALRRLRRVCRFLNRVRTDLSGPWLRAAFVLERLDPHLARVDLLLERGRKADHEEAAALLDGLAARRFLERTPQRARRRATGTVQRRLEAIYDRLARGAGPIRGMKVEERVRLSREARQLEDRIAEGWRGAERGSCPRPTPNLVEPVHTTLPDGMTAIYLWRHGRLVRGYARVGNDVQTQAVLGTTDDVQRDVSRAVFHASRASRSPFAAAAFETALAGLSRRVIAPLLPGLWGPRVHLVLDPRLADVPWELLPLHGAPLATRCELLRIPSVRVRARRRQGGEGMQVIVLGADDPSGLERHIARFGGDVSIRAGRAATRAAVVRALCRCRVVYLAGYGFDAAAAPGVRGVRVADGWFGTGDVPRLVKADLVVLAACRSACATGHVAGAWGGLPAALLAAGARYVLWTAGDVNDEVSADLMQRFQGEQRALDVPAAFGRALGTCREAQAHGGELLAFRLSGVLTRGMAAWS